MSILVTGSEGNLGRALVPELRKRGHVVWGCDLMHSTDQRCIRADVSDAMQLSDVFDLARPEVVYHLAAEFGRKNGAGWPRQLWTTNCLGTRNVIELCVESDAHLIFASSSEAYGNLADNWKCHEGLLATIEDEGSAAYPPHFHCEYALTKFTNEHQIDIAMRTEGLKATVLRFFNVYGNERYTPFRSVICLFIWKLLNKQPIVVYSGSRDFLYVDDWTRTAANVCERLDRLQYPAYNIGGMKPWDIPVLANMVAKEVGADRSLMEFTDAEPNNVAAKRPEVLRAVRDLDHRCEVELEEGIRRTVAWMRKEYGL